MVKFLIIGDLNGNKPIIHFKNFDAIIAPGDFCSDKYHRKLVNAWMKAEWNKGRAKMVDFDKFCKNTLKLTSQDLKSFQKKSLDRGREILEFLNSFGKPVFIIPGNWDQSIKGGEKSAKKVHIELMNRHKWFSSPYTNKKLTKGLKNVYDCQLRGFSFAGYNFVGYGITSVPELPEQKHWTLKKLKKKMTKGQWNLVKKSYAELLKKVEAPYLRLNKKQPLIFLSHNMPYNTSFDKIKKKGSPVNGKHYGSMIARDFILKHEPLVCIGGHMHEYFGKVKLGKTIVINGGFGAKVNTFLEVEGNKIKKVKFYPRPY